MKTCPMISELVREMNTATALVEETQEAQRSSHRRANIARVTIAIVQRTLCLESGRQSQG